MRLQLLITCICVAASLVWRASPSSLLASLVSFLQSVRCAEILGFYVSPEVWCKLVLPAVKTSAGCHVCGTDQASTVSVGPVQCTSCLQVLGALVTGAKRDLLKPYIKVGNASRIVL